jgi:hypothetical protein
LEHLSANFGNLNLSTRGQHEGESSGTNHQWNSNGSSNGDSNGSQQQQQQQQQTQGPKSEHGEGPRVGSNSSHQDWQQLESELNAATAKEFVPGRGWRNQHSSASSVGSGNSSSQRKFCPILSILIIFFGRFRYWRYR